MIRFYNGRVLTMDGGVDVSEQEVWTDGSTIAYVGPAREDAPAFERQIDLNGDLLMPGFKDAHAHTAMTFLRSMADDLPLQEWLFGRVIPLEGRLTPEDIYAFTRLGILEYLSSGITAAFDMYYHRAAIAQAGLDSGFRTVLCGGSASYEIISEEYKRFNSLSPLVRYVPGIHAEYTTSEEEFAAVQQLCRENRAPCFAHNAETFDEVDQCLERRNGLSPTQYMESLGLFDYGGGGFHCIWFGDEDIEIFRRRGLWAVTCPGSNSKLASGIAPISRFLKHEIPLAIGTDGAGSNNALDMFREMYLACVLQKLRESSAAVCPPDEILKAACSGGALAMGLTDCDCIAPGKQADLIVIDLHRPNMRPLLNIPKNLVYSGSKENVRLTMVAGRVLYERGEFFVGEEPERLYETCQKRVEALLQA